MSQWCPFSDFSFLRFTQRTALASTLRHIGEELYKPQVKSLDFSWYRQLNSSHAVIFYRPWKRGCHRFHFPSALSRSTCSFPVQCQCFALCSYLVYCLFFFTVFTHSSSFYFWKRGSVSKCRRGCLLIYKCLSAKKKNYLFLGYKSLRGRINSKKREAEAWNLLPQP